VAQEIQLQHCVYERNLEYNICYVVYDCVNWTKDTLATLNQIGLSFRFGLGQTNDITKHTSR